MDRELINIITLLLHERIRYFLLENIKIFFIGDSFSNIRTKIKIKKQVVICNLATNQLTPELIMES